MRRRLLSTQRCVVSTGEAELCPQHAPYRSEPAKKLHGRPSAVLVVDCIDVRQIGTFDQLAHLTCHQVSCRHSCCACPIDVRNLGCLVFYRELGVWREGIHERCSGRQVGRSCTTQKNVVLQNLRLVAVIIIVVSKHHLYHHVPFSSTTKCSVASSVNNNSYVLEKRLEVVRNWICSYLPDEF